MHRRKELGQMQREMRSAGAVGAERLLVYGGGKIQVGEAVKL
jgi:hypothetical protein